MIAKPDKSATDPRDDSAVRLSAEDVADYCYYSAGDVAPIARHLGLDRLEFALIQARDIAREELRYEPQRAPAETPETPSATRQELCAFCVAMADEFIDITARGGMERLAFALERVRAAAQIAQSGR